MVPPYLVFVFHILYIGQLSLLTNPLFYFYFYPYVLLLCRTALKCIPQDPSRNDTVWPSFTSSFSRLQTLSPKFFLLCPSRSRSPFSHEPHNSLLFFYANWPRLSTLPSSTSQTPYLIHETESGDDFLPWRPPKTRLPTTPDSIQNWSMETVIQLFSTSSICIFFSLVKPSKFLLGPVYNTTNLVPPPYPHPTLFTGLGTTHNFYSSVVNDYLRSTSHSLSFRFLLKF